MANHMLEAPPADRAGDARTDLLATLAAGRELGPEMDDALAASYLAAHPARQALGPRPTGGAQSLNPPLARMGFVVGMVALVAAVIVASGGHALWLLWLPLVLGRWWWGAWWRPHGPWRDEGRGRAAPRMGADAGARGDG